MTPAEYNTQSATQEVNSQGNVNMYVVLKVCIIYFVGDWSNGMIGVSKTFGGSSILSSPVRKALSFQGFIFLCHISCHIISFLFPSVRILFLVIFLYLCPTIKQPAQF